jgi:hypothetical protein
MFTLEVIAPFHSRGAREMIANIRDSRDTANNPRTSNHPLFGERGKSIYA